MFGRLIALAGSIAFVGAYGKVEQHDGKIKKEANATEGTIAGYPVSFSSQRLAFSDQKNTYSLNHGDAISSASNILKQLRESAIPGKPSFKINEDSVRIENLAQDSEIVVTKTGNNMQKISVMSKPAEQPAPWAYLNLGLLGSRKPALETTVPEGKKIEAPANTRITYK